MDRPRRIFSAEPLTVTLIFLCVVATLATVITVYRRPPKLRLAPVVVAPAAPVVKVVEAPVPRPVPTPPPPRPAPAPPPIPEDPTKAIVAELTSAEAEQRLETLRADRQIAALDAATRAAKADSERWKRGLTLTHAQLDAREADARRRESQVEMAGMERDALARRRDAIKATLARDRERPSYAVLPHKGPNGTWQRPIVLECKDESVTIRPNGPTFGLIDLISPFSTRNSPFVAMISREAIRIQRQAGPDGADIAPYIFFIIRPDGVRAYYEARTRLERLGIAFGYELADADWAIDVPDLDQPSTWDGSPPAATSPNESLTADFTTPRGDGSGRGEGTRQARRDESTNAFTWPKGSSGIEGGRVRQDGSIDTLGDPLADGRANGGNGRGLSRDAWNRALAMSGPDRPDGRSESRNGEVESASDGSPTGSGRLDRGTGNGTGRTGMRPGQEDRSTGIGAGRELGDMPHAIGSSNRTDGPLGSENFPGGHGSESAGAVDRRTVAGAETGSGGVDPGSPGESPQAPGAGSRSGTGHPGMTSPADGGLKNRRSGSGSRSTEAASTPGQGSGSADGGSSAGNSGGSGGTPSGPGLSSRPVHPLELVVACSPKGVAVHPGNYRVTIASLKSKDTLLVGQLKAIVAQRERAEPEATIVPAIRFVIEAGGHQTYATAKAQVTFARIDWPTSLQVSGGDTLRLFSTDTWQ